MAFVRQGEREAPTTNLTERSSRRTAAVGDDERNASETIGDDESVAPVTVGDTLDIDGLGPLLVRSTTQRNWSRVGVAEGGDQRFFIKQFIDRVGRAHRKGYLGDIATVDASGPEVPGGVRVVPIVGTDRGRLVNVSPFIEMSTVDEIVHDDHEAFELTAAVGQALATILTERLDTQRESVTIWKGLDPKNIGMDADRQLWVFDFGPATTHPLADAAARVAAAGLLSRWVARPGLHLIRPERDILQNLCRPLSPLTDLGRVERELELHAKLRLREPQRHGVAAIATRAGLLTLGRFHWRRLEHEASLIFPAA